MRATAPAVKATARWGEERRDRLGDGGARAGEGGAIEELPRFSPEAAGQGVREAMLPRLAS